MQLFDGHDLQGWKHVGPGSFIVEHGLLKTQGGMGLLYSMVGPLADCEIKVVYRMEHENDNSGVFIRIPTEPTEPWMPVNRGYEVQIDNHPERSNEDDYHVTGTLYSLTRPLAKPGKPGPEWNTMLIRIEGPRTQVFVNDVKVTDYIEGPARAGQEIALRTRPGTHVPTRAGLACKTTAIKTSCTSRPSVLNWA